MTIGKRLQFIANTVGHCEVLGDVGSDHALLPVYAILNGIAGRAVASDINKGPVERGKKNIAEYNLMDKIEMRLCPGLSGYRAGECDCVVIAGMGGNLIAEILEASPDVAKSVGRFVLSPNSREDYIRRFLWKNGYEIYNEGAVCEDNHQYIVMLVKYTGILTKCDDIIREYFGDFLLKNRDDCEIDKYIQGLKRKLEIRAKGLLSAEKLDEDEYNKIKKLLTALI